MENMVTTANMTYMENMEIMSFMDNMETTANMA
jgi:hypothetical protein